MNAGKGDSSTTDRSQTLTPISEIFRGLCVIFLSNFVEMG